MDATLLRAIRRVLWLTLGSFLIGSLATTYLPVAAEPNMTAATTTWGAPQQIAGDLPAWFPDIAMDRAGATHIIWNTSQASGPTTSGQAEMPQQPPTVRDYLMYERFDSSGGRTATDIGLSSGGEAIRNAILADRDGTLDVLYRSREHIWFIKVPVNDASRASAWSDPHRLSGSGTAYYTAIAQDANGALHVVYTENARVDAIDQTGGTLLRQSLFYRRSNDGGKTWSAPLRISSATSLHGITRPQVRVSGTTIIIVWDEGYDNINGISDPAYGGMRRSTDGGKTWLPIQTIADPAGPIEQVTFAAEKQTRALLVWRQTNKDVLRYATSDDAGATWSNPQTLSIITPRPYLAKHQFDRYALTADSAGTFHLFAVGQTSTRDQLALFHLEMRGETWSALQALYNADGFPEYPGVATDGGNQLVVTFFVRDNLWEIGKYRVWRVSGVAASPSVAPQPIPTVPATPVITVPTPTLPTDEPISALPLGLIAPDDRASIERPPGIVSFGGGILAVIGMVGATMIARLWRMNRN